MAITRVEAKKKAEEYLKKKGYIVKLTDNWLVIVGGGKRIEEQIK